MDNCDQWLDYIVYRLGEESYAYKRFKNEVRFNLKGVGKRPFSYSTSFIGKYSNTLFCQSIPFMRHPTKKRILALTEVMAMMGQQEIKMFPDVNYTNITQSVPSATSKMVIEDFILNESLPSCMEIDKKPKEVKPIGLVVEPGFKVTTPALSI